MSGTAPPLLAPQILLGVGSSTRSEEIAGHLRTAGCECTYASGPDALAALMQDERFSAAILDLHLGEQSTVALCEADSQLLRRMPVLFCANNHLDSLDEAIAAVKAGARDVMVGPVDLAKLEKLTREVFAKQSTRSDQDECKSGAHRDVRRVAPISSGFNPTSPEIALPFLVKPNGNHEANSDLSDTIIGSSAVMASIRKTIAEVASTKAMVMVYGESGTGKELVAAAIHRLSRRADGPFVPVNMAAIPDGLAESLLFGHERGAFTSAVRRQVGYCEAAHGGTLFLDEISAMELTIQPKLLRFLQTGMIQRIGSQTQQAVDVRIVTATNVDPRKLVDRGTLREDLYFRLHVVPIHVPPLRDRPEDIEQLAMVFLKRAARLHEREVMGFTDEALELLRECQWPGNVRQLENIVERMVIFAQGPLVTAAEVPAEVQSHSFALSDLPSPSGQSAGGARANGAALDQQKFSITQLRPIQRRERTAIIEALQRVDGHVVEAAKLLGLGQATVYRKIKLYAIPHQRKRRRVPK